MSSQRPLESIDRDQVAAVTGGAFNWQSLLQGVLQNVGGQMGNMGGAAPSGGAAGATAGTAAPMTAGAAGCPSCGR